MLTVYYRLTQLLEEETKALELKRSYENKDEWTQIEIDLLHDRVAAVDERLSIILRENNINGLVKHLAGNTISEYEFVEAIKNIDNELRGN
jgi:hypothetical protein